MAEQGLDGSEDYYLIWLQTLIEIMQEKGIIDLETLDALKGQWIDAYTDTAWPSSKIVRWTPPDCPACC